MSIWSGDELQFIYLSPVDAGIINVHDHLVKVIIVGSGKAPNPAPENLLNPSSSLKHLRVFNFDVFLQISG